MGSSMVESPTQEELVELVVSVNDVLPVPESTSRRARMTARGRVVLSMVAVLVVLALATALTTLTRHPTKPAVADTSAKSQLGPPPTILFPLQRPSD
jgi:hypothetical protein